MSHKVSEDPKFAIICGTTSKDIADEIAGILEKKLVKCKIGKFANGEPDVLIEESVRGKTVFLIQTSLTDEVASDIIETMAIADALYRAHCHEVFLVQLMYPMARQDRREAGHDGKPRRRPISAKVVADMFQDVAGFRGVITMHLHAQQIEGFFDPKKCIVENVNPASIFINYLKQEGILNGDNSNVMLLSPDVGGASAVQLLSAALNLPPYGIVDKRRPKTGVSEVMNIIGHVKDMTVIIWDDMVDSGGTAVKSAEKVLELGAKEVLLVATHPVLTGKAEENLLTSPFTKIIFSNTLPIPDSFKSNPKFVQLSVGPMLSSVIANIYNDEPLEDIVRINTEESISV